MIVHPKWRAGFQHEFDLNKRVSKLLDFARGQGVDSV
jgi:hypothetical protein